MIGKVKILPDKRWNRMMERRKMGAEKRRKDILQEALDRMKTFGRGPSRPITNVAFFDD